MQKKIAFILIATALLLPVVKAQPANSSTSEKTSWMRSIHEGKGDFGKYPEKYEQVIKSYFEESLKDPYSAKYDFFRKPLKDIDLIDIDSQKALYGYSACVSVNAKNSYGGYTGKRIYWFLLYNNSIVKVIGEDAMASQLAEINCAHPKVKP